jgi:hypothetical protein
MRMKREREERTYELQWQPMAIPSPNPGGSWLILGSSPLNHRLAGSLGGSVATAADDRFDADNIVYAGAAGDDCLPAAQKDYDEALGVLRSLVNRAQRKRTRLWLVSQGLGSSVLGGLG